MRDAAMVGINWGDPYTYIGIVGVTLMMIGIWRIRTKSWNNKSPLYELDTIVGAGCILVYQLHLGSYITIPMSLLWVLISFKGLTSYAERYAHRKLKRRKSNRKR